MVFLFLKSLKIARSMFFFVLKFLIIFNIYNYITLHLHFPSSMYPINFAFMFALITTYYEGV